MLTLLCIGIGLTGIFFIYLILACLIAAAQENSLPDIEDIEVKKSLS